MYGVELYAAVRLAVVDEGLSHHEAARRELALESLLARLDRYHLLILDDLAYVQKDQAETSVLFELISARCALTQSRQRAKPPRDVR